MSSETVYLLKNTIQFDKLFTPSISEAIFIAFKMWIIFILGHFSIGIFLLFKDLSGEWDKYKIIPDKKIYNKIHKYKLCIPYLIRDLFFLLPIFLSLYAYNTKEFINLQLNYYEFLYELFIKTPIAYVIGNIWDMTIHRLWHTFPFLYKYVHKEHHIDVNEMCSLSAWRDSYWEFIFEIPGTFLIGPFLMRMNWLTHSLIISSMGFISSIDHSGFYVNYLIDSRYHFYHHLRPNNNFADIEFLDSIFKTKLEN